MDQRELYRSYLLRVWHTLDGDTCRWRATLTAVDNGAIVRFGSQDELCAFLKALELDPNAAAQPPPEPPSA